VIQMIVRRHDDAAEFWDVARSWLLESEAANNLIIGLALRNSRNPSCAVPDEYWATVEDSGSIAGCAFRTPPLRAVVSQMPAAAAAALCDDMLERYRELPGVTGATSAAKAFANHWGDRSGSEWVVHMSLRIHVLDKVRFPASPPAGKIRVAEQDDADLVRDWLARFAEETRTELRSDELVRQLLTERRARIWDDAGPRCLVAAARDTPGCGAINAVYTPVEHRQHGYATAAVAALSDELLRSGKRRCCLYTDLANLTSNSIYANIGYTPIRDDMELTFLRDPA